MRVAAYSKPGVLCDCTAPGNFAVQTATGVATGSFPHSFKKLSLDAITAQLCAPFGIAYKFVDSPGAPFDKVEIKFDENIHSFLVELAKQRGLLIANERDGTMVFVKSRTGGVPVVAFAEGKPPLTSIAASFSAQDYYSHITGFVPAKKRKHGSTYTVVNPLAIGAFRPHACKFDDIEKADAPTATMAKLGRMFANSVAYTIDDLPTWRDPKGRLWEPNTLLTVRAPSAMIYAESTLLIRGVKLRQSHAKLSASLDLVLPEAFSGEFPKKLPWIE